ncbi:CDGSH iron-sulfur domain-containing protein [Leptospira fainei]|uniref:CDGSH iron-sulfur domain-containing protein n=1 Tax=Leptospira fainei TaxID=48782 RepID=UPI000587798E|nr:CDGSH iron-sulfur domain-containing protein [Leptospira fainei]
MDTIKGKSVTIFFDGKKCIHSRNCVLSRPDVFVPNVDGDWIYPDRASEEEIKQLALNCPSGAIKFETNSSTSETAPIVNVVRVRENGPLAFNADMDIVGHGLEFRATLCRCGASKNKPFCDSSHTTIQFMATGEPAAALEPKTLVTRNGKLLITPTKNGPLKIQGNLEICTGTGHMIDRIEEAYLCRCGGSSNKPYCDGTHKKIKFLSE